MVWPFLMPRRRSVAITHAQRVHVTPDTGTGVRNDSVAAEWFTDYMLRAKRGAKNQKILGERTPRPSDRILWQERAYDADTAALLAVIRAHQGRGSTPRGETPPMADGAVRRLLDATRMSENLRRFTAVPKDDHAA